MTEQGHLFPLDTDEEETKSLHNGQYHMRLSRELRDEVFEAHKLSVDLGERASSLALLDEANRDIVVALEKHRNPHNINKPLYKARAKALDRKAFKHFKKAWGYKKMTKFSDDSVLGIEKALIEDYEDYLLRQKESVGEIVDEWRVKAGARPRSRKNSTPRSEDRKPWDLDDARGRAAGVYKDTD